MKTIRYKPTPPLRELRQVGHPGNLAPASGIYHCLCCGVVLWRVREGRPLPECPSNNCPTMWLWSGR